ncbi:response regulator [Paenibacillus jiagnxiensis]|uniref:response regulator n=1 Tax=Paenibacillus jiagnxiensis TaxID=3228926 RepID=UPI0033BD3AFC
MFQVLLIDDEPLVHQHLWSLWDWRSHGFELCGQAYNGDMALQMLERTRPHIAIIDVDMPGMNGVQLQGMIRERFPSVKTIMLSSYDDYDYVRECLKNGAVDYLLKHRLDGEALMGVLHKAMELQQQGRNPVSRMVNRENEMLESMNPRSFREHIAELVRGKPGAVKELELYGQHGGQLSDTVCYAAAAVQIASFLLLTESHSDVETNRLVQQAVDIMQQSLGDLPARTAAYVENGRFVVMFAFKDRSEQAAASEAAGLLGKLRHSLELFLNLKCIYAFGHVCSSLLQLAGSYRSAERALDALPPREQTGAYNERVSLTIEEQKQLLLSVESLDNAEVQRLITSIFASIRTQPLHSQTVQMIVSELLSIGDKAIQKWMPTDKTAAGKLPSREELRKIGSVGELEQWLKSYYDGLLGRLKQLRAEGPYSRHVSQAILLILERYQGYITLEMAAGAIGLHPSYLSRIFKEETKSTFSEYVNKVRIDASCRLLESGCYSVKQISSQVGFTTYNYFFKVFKELTGMTPHAYMGRLRRNEPVK